MTTETIRNLDVAKRALDAARAAARRAGDTFRCETLARTYEEWMQARAANGDRFALSLGYVGDGTWSLEAWERGFK